MLIELAYGRTGLTVDFPDDRTTVIESAPIPGLPDPGGALLNAIRNPIGTRPLRQLAGPQQRVAIAVAGVGSTLEATILAVLLRDLAHVPSQQIVVVIAAGAYRGKTSVELDQVLGSEATRNLRVVSHSGSSGADLKRWGETPEGVPIWLNRHWVDSDVKIAIGMVQPHPKAGFTGGPMTVAPGLAGRETVAELGGASLLRHPKSSWGITNGNPLHEAIRQIAGQTGVDFCLDVTANQDRKITSVYAGEMLAVHRAACQVSRRAAMRPVMQRFEVVVTTGGGHPGDLDLCQAIEGISAAAQVVREGGAIVCASQCSDALPDHAAGDALSSRTGGGMERANRPCSGAAALYHQWQVEMLDQITLRAMVYLKSEHLPTERVRAAHMEPIEDIEGTVSELLHRYGPNARVCVLPHGPAIVPYVEPTGAG